MPYYNDSSSSQPVPITFFCHQNSAEVVGEVSTGSGDEIVLYFHHHCYCYQVGRKTLTINWLENRLVQ